MSDRHDLPFNPKTMDIVCYRVLVVADDERSAESLHFNIPQRHRHHSPSGFEWGYGGSGPHDFALNVLALYLPNSSRRTGVELWDGTRVSQRAWDLHHDFCRDFIAGLPSEGGRLDGDAIRDWLRTKRVKIDRWTTQGVRDE